jgi:hypothetical protein
MAEGQIRIGIAGGTATTFSTSPVPAITLSRVQSGQLLSDRSEISPLTIVGRSNYGTLAVGGPAYSTKYQWALNAVITDADSLVLGGLLEWQRANPDEGLRLIDEVQPLDPVDSQPRTLLSTIAPSWNAGYEYGFGVFSVLLLVEPNWRQRFGRPSEGLWSINLGAEEL